MKLAELDLKRNHVIEQLAALKYYDVDGKTYEELKRNLAVIRSMRVDNECSSNAWF